MQIRADNTCKSETKTHNESTKSTKNGKAKKNETGKNILQGISADVRYGVTQIKAAISP